MPAQPHDVAAEDRHGRAIDIGAVGLGIFLLGVAVLATGSGADHLSGGRSVVLGQGLTGFLVGSAIMTVAVGAWVWYVLIRTDRGPVTARARVRRWPWWLRSLIGLAFLAMVVAVVEALVGSYHHHVATQSGPQALARIGQLGQVVPGRQNHPTPAFSVGLALAVLVGLVVIAAGLRGRAPDRDQPDDDDDDLLVFPDRAPLVAALSASLADLEGEPDPRRAVIAAYTHMQALLGVAGIHRRASETEPELLARALDQFGADVEPASRLTDLFERARYSPHVVDEAMRTAAISAMRSLRDGLVVTA